MLNMYSAQVLDHFEHPRNAGELADASVAAQIENPACGDIMQLALKIENGIITAARFRTRGCVASIACSSLLTELVTGKSVAEARKIQPQQILDALGGLNRESIHASHLVVDALTEALNRLQPKP
jgi:nitrogen fixation NifU-like protein